jgi:hypothetical protein
MTELNVENVLLFVILAVLLYHLIGGCGCGGNGFRVGGESDIESELCYGKNQKECDTMGRKCTYFDNICHETCIGGRMCKNGLCKDTEDGGRKCECTPDTYGDLCEYNASDDCLNGNNRKDDSCQIGLNGCCPNLGGVCKYATKSGYGTCTM